MQRGLKPSQRARGLKPNNGSSATGHQQRVVNKLSTGCQRVASRPRSEDGFEIHQNRSDRGFTAFNLIFWIIRPHFFPNRATCLLSDLFPFADCGNCHGKKCTRLGASWGELDMCVGASRVARTPATGSSARAHTPHSCVHIHTRARTHTPEGAGGAEAFDVGVDHNHDQVEGNPKQVHQHTSVLVREVPTCVCARARACACSCACAWLRVCDEGSMC